MGDVAQILKGTGGAGALQEDVPNKAMRMTGISKDVMTLLAGKQQDPKSAALPPIVPTLSSEVKVKVGSKMISSAKAARQWTWAPFASSARTDGALFRHWVRANVEYTDYPYAKFDIHLDPVIYSDEDYEVLLKSESWTKSETDKLMDFCRIYELRWPVIHDRWIGFFNAAAGEGVIPGRKIEDLQERYYSVAAILAQARIRQEAAAEVQALTGSGDKAASSDPSASETANQIVLETAAARALATAAPKAQPLMTQIGTGTTNKFFNASQERERRSQLDRMWKRSKEEEKEEMELRKELREIETQLRKLKKSGGHILAAAASGNRVASTTNARNSSRAATPVPASAIVESPEILDQSFASTAPVPVPQNPYWQSGRLAPPASGGAAGINKTMLNRMNQVLEELKVPLRPLPTKRVCDLYDSVRKDILLLLTLQKLNLQKEGTIHTKRVKLSKLGGSDGKVLDEEELLGIAPPPAPPAPAPTPTSKKGSNASSTKSKSKSATKGKGATKTKASGDTTTTKKKPAPKRKRKPETKDTATKPASTSTSSTSKTTGTSAPAEPAPGAPSAVSKTPTNAAKTAPSSTPTDSNTTKRPRKT